MTISVITPVYNPSADVLRECIESVLGQTYDDWELCLIDDRSTAAHVYPILDEYATSDRRVRVMRRATNGGIVAASNDALALATGEFVALLDHDDLLHPNALELVARELDGNAEIDYLYTDEDHLDLDGKRFDPFYKPDWSPERFRSQMYTCHLSVLRRALVDVVGGFREGFDGAQDYDLVLRVVEQARTIAHIPRVLYHWRMGAASTSSNADAKPWAYDAGVRAVQAHCDRVGIDAVVEPLHVLGCHRVHRRLASHPLVSVVIPTAGTRRSVYGVERTFVVEAVRDLVERTTYEQLEIVVVIDRTAPEEVVEELEQIGGDRLRLVWFDEPFNFSKKVNHGALVATGELLLLLNDDIQVVNSDWLDVMVALVQDPGVGMVGARLLFSDGTLQHAGHVYVGNPYHIFFLRDPQEVGPSGLLQIEREVSGVTAACALVRASVFREVGGMSTQLPNNFNDVDFSLKIRHVGHRIVWTPHATLFHFESQSRVPTVQAHELDFLHRRWAIELAQDPYHNVNLEPLRDDWLPRYLELK